MYNDALTIKILAFEWNLQVDPPQTWDVFLFKILFDGHFVSKIRLIYKK